jgi:hypothetical protein
VSKPFIALLAAVVAISMIVVGCGGGDDSTDSASLTKAQFVKQADAICTEGDKQNEKEFEDFAKEHNLSEGKEPSKAVQEEAVQEIVVPGVRQQIEEIDDLGAPKGDEAKIEDVVTSVEEGLDELEEDPTLLFKGKNPLEKGSTLAREYGMAKCGSES